MSWIMSIEKYISHTNAKEKERNVFFTVNEIQDLSALIETWSYRKNSRSACSNF